MLSVISEAWKKYKEAVEGIAKGQYEIGSKDIFKNAINITQAVYDKIDATQKQISEAIEALNTATTKFVNSKISLVVPIIPPIPSVTRDDTTDKVYGMVKGLEYNLDGAGYVGYDATIFNAINFSGNHTLLVRVAPEGNNPAGLEITLTFTKNRSHSSSSNRSNDNNSSSSNSLSDNSISSNATSTVADTVKIQKSEDVIIKQATTAWQLVDGNWYLLKDNGAKATDWQQVNGNWYYLDSNGTMATGWQQVNGNWYYLDSNGAMATGWQQVNGNWYYLYSDGAMASNTVIEGYKVDASGAWI